ncbi:MAG TPA: type I-C CRISPR-associated protein Cas7/Csd2 [Syntrophorhabdaceae bacterium]|jgi:CRISPR-associated protein Csd2|nr:type I-C CRISPR-associated protein Cas7/Csd2 [Syntrophorhabdaceae bacterium]HOF57000.1 type I-C CRISPR-associated protein Cas7/Csd2 [Syntrophorhabdaceae bacterium]HOS04942.1 type I-C CRISPR-associated protein Cas7/Csd2 [Syntrophorhabdaceae bacterium]HPL40232.1 type I-C CRISPR-associated protein Cas7/Csd2 [Syntrophorhabdaceae bacterium]
MGDVIKNRYDFVFFFDVKDGNPNGDPDQLNLPRADAEDQHGLVTDVCIKRKIRNYVMLEKKLEPPFDIFIRQKQVLNRIIDGTQGETIQQRQNNLCERYFDIRTFGAVLSVGEKGAGTVRGPVQLTFSRSEDRIYQAEHSITRCAVTTEEDAKKQESREYATTFGRKSTIPYALYRMHGFISASDAIKTNFSEEDLKLLWKSLINAFEHDRAAARGEMSPVKLVIFKHESHLGNALSGQLFKRVSITRKSDLPRKIEDYQIVVNKDSLPPGVTMQEWPEEDVY